MNRYLALAIVGCGLIVSPLFVPLASSAVPQAKIGLINIDKMLQETPAGKRANDSFNAVRKAKQAALDKEKDDFVKAEADLKKQAPVLKPDILEQRKGELQKKYADLNELAAKLEHDLATESQKTTASLMKQAQPIIEKIAKDEGVQLILDAHQAVWSDPTLDLTAKLNAQMK